MRMRPLIAFTALSVGSLAMADETPKYDAAAIKTVPAAEVRLGFQRHGALAQYFLWNQRSENDAATVDFASDILDEAVTFKSSPQIHATHRERAGTLPNSGYEAHDVKSTMVNVNADGTMVLTANVHYLNRSKLRHARFRGADLTYKITMRPTETVLPKFTKIEIVHNRSINTATFAPQYAANRVKSLVYYWLALVDNPKRNAEPFKEIFCDDFSLNFSVGRLDTFQKFKSWYGRTAAQVTVSTHIINSLTYEEVAPHTYKVVADLDWQGILPDGKIFIGRTIDTWTLIDNPTERFARIKSEDVNILIPFQPKP